MEPIAQKLAPQVKSTAAARRLPGRLPPRAFFRHPPEWVAPRLLGKLLIHRLQDKNGTKYLAGRIVETEAYLGPHNRPPDPAAHSHGGPTPRNQVIFGPAAHAYVYAIYGRYFCMNVTCEPEGLAGCVLIRALEPVLGLDKMADNRGLNTDATARRLTSGPGRLSQAMGLTRDRHNGLDLLDSASPLQLQEDGFSVSRVLVTRRIGIRHAAERPLRFALPGNPCVSGPRNFSGKIILLA